MIEQLEAYRRAWPEEQAAWERMIAFLHSSPEVFRREHPPGHFTGSALITDPSLNRVALTLHGKLGRWLQFGGHADGEEQLALVALREAEEESGLPDLRFYPFEDPEGIAPLPMDIDVHEIPAFGSDPPHLHYDVRYLLVTEQGHRLTASAESKQVGWFDLDEAFGCTTEESMHRQFRKLQQLRALVRR